MEDVERCSGVKRRLNDVTIKKDPQGVTSLSSLSSPSLFPPFHPSLSISLSGYAFLLLLSLISSAVFDFPSFKR
jgi:hypothetical protein